MTETNKTQAETTTSAEKEVPSTSKKDKTKHSSQTPNSTKVQPEASAEKTAAKPNKNADPSESSKANTPQEKAPNTVVVTKEKKSGFGLSLLAITMVLALGGTGYHFGLLESTKLNAKIDDLNRQISSLNTELAQTNTNHSSLVASVKQENERLQILLNQQDNNLASMQNALIELKGRRPNDWLLAEADHLIKQAGRQLWVEKDIPTSIRLVETADQRIAQLNDPSLLPIRQALADDIHTLKSIVLVDSDGIAIRISSLQNQVNDLVLANALLGEEVKELAPKEVSGEISNWKENLTTSVKNFADQFITYRKREGTVVPLLTPAQTFYLQENIKAKLAQAINSVYRENTELYLSSLASAKQWVNDFYHLEMPETQAFITAIDELEQQVIKVSYPAKLTSINLINNELSARLSKELSTLVNSGGQQ